MLLAAILVLGAGTWTIRLSGILLRDRLRLAEPVQKILPMAATTLLAALAITAALMESGAFAGVARPAGVLAGALLAARRAPFVVVIVAAAATSALLRLAGVS